MWVFVVVVLQSGASKLSSSYGECSSLAFVGIFSSSFRDLQEAHSHEGPIVCCAEVEGGGGCLPA